MKKLIALALVLSLSVISIGCGGSTTPSSKPTGAAGASTSSTEVTKSTEVKK